MEATPITGMYSFIDGRHGIYDNKVKNESVRYGRNTVYNQKNSVTVFANCSVASNNMGIQIGEVDNSKKLNAIHYPDLCIDVFNTDVAKEINYKQTYMPKNNGKIDTMALMGASYEEMDKNIEIPVSILANNIAQSHQFSASIDEIAAHYFVSQLDINNDKKIDLSEYALTILLADVLSDYGNCPKVDGSVTGSGKKNAIRYLFNYDKIQQTVKVMKKMYQHYKLKEAQEKFLSDENNLI